MAETWSNSRVKQFIYSMQDQGVGVTRTKKGLFLRLPNGDSTSVHFTNSDVRADQNLMARLRRAGVRHPLDPKGVNELPTTITEAGPPANRTQRTILEYIETQNYPEVVQVSHICKQTGLEWITVSRALYHMGFLPTKGKRGARDWITPDELIVRPEPEPEPEVIEEPEPEPEPEVEEPEATPAGDGTDKIEQPVNATPESTTFQKTVEPREFIDNVDSWTVNLKMVPPPVYDYLRQLRSAGLEVEIRVWRTPHA